MVPSGTMKASPKIINKIQVTLNRLSRLYLKIKIKKERKPLEPRL